MGVSDLIASALGAGLEARITADTVNDRRSVGDGESVSRGSADVDGRKQVATIRLGGNRFLPLSWRRVLVPLSVCPPRKLDLAWASVVSCSFTVPTEPTSDDQDSRQTATTAALAMVAAPEEQNYARDTSTNLPAVSAPAQFSVSLASSSLLSSSPRQPLCELLAATILPVDAPGLEVLNLLGSTGLWPVDSNHRHADTTVGEGPGEGRIGRGASEETERIATRRKGDGDSELVSSSAFLLLLLDGLMSPLCRTTSLLLSGVRRDTTPSSAPSNTHQDNDTNTEVCRPSTVAMGKPFGHAGSGLCRANTVLGPGDVKSLCYAASTCASLRFLDLAGCDLSGLLGASAVAAAVTCLVTHNVDDDDHFGDHSSVSYDDDSTSRRGRAEGERHASTAAVAAPAGVGLSRLSLRACNMGTAGLSAALGALVSVILWGDGTQSSRVKGSDNNYYRTKERLRRLPLLLDLSDNRPAASSSQRRDDANKSAAGAEGRGSREERASDVAASEDFTLGEITKSLCELQRNVSASVMPLCDSKLLSGRYVRF